MIFCADFVRINLQYAPIMLSLVHQAAIELPNKVPASAGDAEKKMVAELKGSEKQIVWAEQIRAKKIAEFEAAATRAAAATPEQKKGHEDTDRKIALLREKLNTESDCRWWIDRKDDGLSMLLKEIK